MGPGMSTEPEVSYRIGEVAARTGVSTRTLRYYEELGLIDLPGKSSGGSRRYAEADVARIERVLELRNVMGFDLERIAGIVRAEQRLELLREEYHRGVTRRRHLEIVDEAAVINDELRTHVADKLATLRAFAADLDARAGRLHDLQAELHADLAAEPTPSS
jgi:MerR family transcriptional regulator, repressor of the yfmOP operon